MDQYNFFIDESGSANPKTFLDSPYFSLCGVLITDKNRKILKANFERLKIKYFKQKNFVFHASEIKYQLRKNKQPLEAFVKDLKIILLACDYSLIYVVVNKEKAKRKGWNAIHIYKETYSIILANLLRFLVAKKIKGQIFAEASNFAQDTNLYKSFFYLIRRGLDNPLIDNKEARSRFTSLSFVTKNNNDAEEQLADFFGIFGRLKIELDLKIRSENQLNGFEKLIKNIAEKRLFVVKNAKDERKISLYKEIDSFKIIP